MGGSACLDYVKLGGTRKLAKFQCRAKHGHAPGWITTAANTAVCCPKAPAPEFADDKPTSGLQNAGHFPNHSLGIWNEAKGGHRQDKIKCCLFKW
jgi:hypothetical protein